MRGQVSVLRAVSLRIAVGFGQTMRTALSYRKADWGTAAFGATLPFAQASLNDRLLHAYLPLVRGGSGSRAACAIVVMKGKGDTYASNRPTSGPVTSAVR